MLWLRLFLPVLVFLPLIAAASAGDPDWKRRCLESPKPSALGAVSEAVFGIFRGFLKGASERPQSECIAKAAALQIEILNAKRTQTRTDMELAAAKEETARSVIVQLQASSMQVERSLADFRSACQNPRPQGGEECLKSLVNAEGVVLAAIHFLEALLSDPARHVLSSLKNVNTLMSEIQVLLASRRNLLNDIVAARKQAIDTQINEQIRSYHMDREAAGRAAEIEANCELQPARIALKLSALRQDLSFADAENDLFTLRDVEAASQVLPFLITGLERLCKKSYPNLSAEAQDLIARYSKTVARKPLHKRYGEVCRSLGTTAPQELRNGCQKSLMTDAFLFGLHAYQTAAAKKQQAGGGGK